MILDAHTHIFPPEVATEREPYLRDDATFRALYDSPRAVLATADDLLVSMDGAGIDVSVALGFAWSDPETCRLHNDYLLQAAAVSQGRILPFGTLPLAAGPEAVEAEARRCAAAGMPGFGELRPDNAAFDLLGRDGARLADMAMDLNTVLLFHVTEPAGHDYAGKDGLALAAFYRFVSSYPEVRTIGAHWGGGLPFFALMPEVKKLFEAGLSVDTAAGSLLYGDAVYTYGAGLIGAEHILYGSDYPLLGQKRSLRRIRESGLDRHAQALILGDNAAALLGLS